MLHWPSGVLRTKLRRIVRRAESPRAGQTRPPTDRWMAAASSATQQPIADYAGRLHCVPVGDRKPFVSARRISAWRPNWAPCSASCASVRLPVCKSTSAALLCSSHRSQLISTRGNSTWGDHSSRWAHVNPAASSRRHRLIICRKLGVAGPEAGSSHHRAAVVLAASCRLDASLAAEVMTRRAHNAPTAGRGCGCRPVMRALVSRWPLAAGR